MTPGEQPPVPAAPAPMTAPVENATGRVLLVEDDPGVRIATEAVLAMHFEVASASSGEEALGIVERQELDVLVVDFQLPRLDGLSMVQRALEQRPHLVAIMLTGHAEESVVQAARTNEQVVAVLSKPADPESLRRWVTSGVRAARMRRARARLSTRSY
jgi:CheY-like chemotaxis protein